MSLRVDEMMRAIAVLEILHAVPPFDLLLLTEA